MQGPARYGRTALLAVACLAVIGIGVWSRTVPSVTGPVIAAGQDEPRQVTVTARKYAFSPARIEVTENDLVKITLQTADIPHSFTIDAYRIAKRASPGHPAVFEFRADQVGTFPIYCNLTTDDGCKNMKAELVVRPKK